MSKLVALALVVVATIGCGCRSQLVTVEVYPTDATVIANGVAYNTKSPFSIEARTDRELSITAYKEGYREKIHTVDYSLSKFGKIEAWTSFLVLPLIGLCFDNAWQLDENNISLTLDPITPEAQQEASKIIKAQPYVNSKPMDTEAEKIFNQLR